MKLTIYLLVLLITLEPFSLFAGNTKEMSNDFNTFDEFKLVVNNYFLESRSELVNLLKERFSLLDNSYKENLTVDNVFINQHCGPVSRALKLIFWRDLGIKSFIVRQGSVYTGYNHAFLRLLVHTSEGEEKWFKLDPTHKQYLKGKYSIEDLIGESPAPTLLIEEFFPTYQYKLDQEKNDLPDLFL